jgi:hypothetical protein
MTLEEVWFAKPPNYREGKQTVLQVRGVASVEDEVVDEEKESYYSLGDGWEPDDGGESATHGSGKTQFNSNSSMGKFIVAAVGLGDEVTDILKSRGETFQAETWRGLRFHFVRTEFEFKDRKTGESNIYAVDLPTEFLGEDSGDDKPAPAPKPKTSPRSRGKKAEAEAEAEAEVEAETATEAKPGRRRRKKAEDVADDALRQEVIGFAAEFEDDAHGDFMAAVLDADEFDRANDVQADEELLNDIIDAEGAVWTASREIELPE